MKSLEMKNYDRKDDASTFESVQPPSPFTIEGMAEFFENDKNLNTYFYCVS